MKTRKLLLIMMALALTLGMATTAFAADPSSWAKDEVDKAISLSLVPGGLQSDYQTAITREDFCILIMNLVYLSEEPAAIEEEEEEAVEETAATEEKEAVEDEAEEEATEAESPFTDTDNEDVIAAAGLDIVNGRGDGIFDPSGSISRQEAAAMLTRAAKVMGMSTAAAASSFADADKIAGWAKESVDFVFAAGVMQGTGNEEFSPTGTYTREQSILTVLRLCNALTGDADADDNDAEDEEGDEDDEGEEKPVE